MRLPSVRSLNILGTVTTCKSSSKLLATRSARLIAACALMASFAYPNRLVSGDDGVNPRALALKEFTDRVKDYTSLQKKIESGLPALKPSKESRGYRRPSTGARERHRKGPRCGEARRHLRKCRRSDPRGDQGRRTGSVAA